MYINNKSFSNGFVCKQCTLGFVYIFKCSPSLARSNARGMEVLYKHTKEIKHYQATRWVVKRMH